LTSSTRSGSSACATRCLPQMYPVASAPVRVMTTVSVWM
jgi:hypothetical protein